jgi:hypothetical protein
MIAAATCSMRDVAASDEPATHCIDMAADRRRDDRHRRTGQMQFFNSGSSLALTQSGIRAQRADSVVMNLSISAFVGTGSSICGKWPVSSMISILTDGIRARSMSR